MKVKATVATVDSIKFPKLAQALDDLAAVFTNLRDEAQAKVLGPNITGVDKMGPAELFFQTSDRMGLTESGLGCDIQVSRASTSIHRAPASFSDALIAFEKLCKEKIREHLPRGERMQLLMSFAVDAEVPDSKGNFTTLPETDASWVDGEA